MLSTILNYVGSFTSPSNFVHTDYGYKVTDVMLRAQLYDLWAHLQVILNPGCVV